MNPKTSFEHAGPVPPPARASHTLTRAVRRWLRELADSGYNGSVRRRRMLGGCLVLIGLADLISNIIGGGG
jgi:hypothetical protein